MVRRKLSPKVEGGKGGEGKVGKETRWGAAGISPRKRRAAANQKFFFFFVVAVVVLGY